MSTEEFGQEPGAFYPVPKLNVKLTPDVELESLLDIVSVIYKQSGCLSCGRLSFTIDAIDPEIILPATRGLLDFPAVQSVRVAD